MCVCVRAHVSSARFSRLPQQCRPSCQEPRPQFVCLCELNWEDGCAVTFRRFSGEVVCKAHGRVPASGKNQHSLSVQQAGTQTILAKETDTIYAGDLKCYVERILRRENLVPETSFHIRLVFNGKVLRDDAIISGRHPKNTQQYGHACSQALNYWTYNCPK